MGLESGKLKQLQKERQDDYLEMEENLVQLDDLLCFQPSISGILERRQKGP